MTTDDPQKLGYAGATRRSDTDGTTPQRLGSVPADDVLGDDLDHQPGLGTAQDNHAPRAKHRDEGEQ